jgi:hypothetical protein
MNHFVASLLGGGVVSAILTYWLNGRRARREFFVNKLEEIYDAVRRFTAECRRRYIGPVGQYLLEKINFPSLGEQLTAGNEIEHRRKGEMLIRLYFPEAKPAFDQLNSAWDSMFKLCARVQYQGGIANETERIECLEIWNTQSADFDEKVEKLAGELTMSHLVPLSEFNRYGDLETLRVDGRIAPLDL